MSFAKQFEHFFNREHRDIATIVTEKGDGLYAATTESSVTVTISGTGYSVGDKVFYDVITKQILSKAPSLSYTDLPV